MLEQQIEPSFIGIHGMNRDGHGIAWKDAERLLQAILDVGFDAGSVIQPTCSERMPGDNESHVFNERISQESRGRVPSISDQHSEVLEPILQPPQHHSADDCSWCQMQRRAVMQ